ncbi:MAG: LacI family DNA-binding transcriptional regulator [Ardenticatenaceae bacterium]|nr:LacI family DNA-binding transcriptional regulator [Ardenticatenaceae bacterium]
MNPAPIFPENDRATIEDVARAAGVSTATVSRVLNNSGKVASQTIERVQNAITQLNYVAHGGARSLAATKTNTIGLIIPAASTLFFSSLLSGINSALSAHGYDFLIYATLTPASTADGNPLTLGPHNSDGLLIFTDSVDDPTLRRLARREFPMVLLHRRSIDQANIPTIRFNNFDSSYQLISHLIENCGRKRIAFLRGPDGNEDSQRREAGYRQALENHGLRVTTELIGDGLFQPEPAARQVQSWLDQGVTFDAIFTGDDNAAMGVIELLDRAGVRVPDDVSVVGFNDDVLSRYLNPALTTVVAPADQLGEKAAELLIQLIAGEIVPDETVLPTRLIVRASCGCQSQAAES